jgi:hypothetical protein
MTNELERKAESVKFLEFHQPPLASGDYDVTITQSIVVKANVAASKDQTDTFSATKHFTVAGERFELNPIDVLGVFPPEGNLGEHFNVLPHIMLNRSTLPWERTAEAESSPESSSKSTPWLALLLFDEDQKPTPKIVKAGDLRNAPPAGTKFPSVTLETAQQVDDALTVIDVPHDVLKNIMPTAEELKLLAHVRSALDNKGQLVGDELAIIIANRLPQKGKISTVHLVSVEGRFKKTRGAYQFDYQEAAGNDLIRLVSLKSWSFACEDPKKHFKDLLVALNGSPATLRLPETGKSVDELLAKGFVLLPHSFREGDETASWFHGPLTPGKDSSTKLDLPARSSDELVRYDPTLAMFDVSYAAAWELGRLMALQDKDFSTGLYQWKRQHAQQVARGEQGQENNYLPYQTAVSVPIPKTISEWFERLWKLEGVPFNYLVPDERMLPAESIRFFRVDRAWIRCLADGAFSIGRVASSDVEADASHGEDGPTADFPSTLTGFLMRSEVVSGWPGLIVDGYSDRDGNRRVEKLRLERLASGVLLCIFEGEVSRVNVHQKPETLHFGFAHSNGAFSKVLRNAQGAPGNVVKVEHWRKDSDRTLNVAVFAESVGQALTPKAALTSAQFAFQMVEGSANIIFLTAKT